MKRQEGQGERFEGKKLSAKDTTLLSRVKLVAYARPQLKKKERLCLRKEKRPCIVFYTLVVNCIRTVNLSYKSPYTSRFMYVDEYMGCTYAAYGHMWSNMALI